MDYQSYMQELEKVIRVANEFGDNKQGVLSTLWKKLEALESEGGEGLKLLELDFSGFSALCARQNSEPKSNIWISFFIIYYLIEELKETPVTLNHVYSGYIHLQKPLPRNLEQNLRDLVHKYHVIEMEDGHITISDTGKAKMGIDPIRFPGNDSSDS